MSEVVLDKSHTDALEWFAQSRSLVDDAISKHLPLIVSSSSNRFNEAMNYALFPGGKRIRPFLTLLGAQLIGPMESRVLMPAVAVEFIHNSSLIIDDLPCMDNARVRRGNPPLHAKFGEATSLLVAIALLNASYGLVVRGCNNRYEDVISIQNELVNSIGVDGMIAGQVVDLFSKGNEVQPSKILGLKTTALIRFSLRLGAITMGANDRQLGVMSTFAELLGRAFQLSDDLIDWHDDAAERHDAERENIALEIRQSISDAKHALASEFGSATSVKLLCHLADYVMKRKEDVPIGVPAAK